MAAGLGGLSGTLTADQLLSQLEIIRQRQAQELAQRSQQAAQASQAAGQDYQTAAQAPPDQLNPADQFLPTLLSGIASVITQDPSFRSRAQEGIRSKQQEMLKARADNLQGLRDTSLQRAKLAQEAGDLEMTHKFQTETEKLNKLLEQLGAKEKQDFTANEARLDRESAERRATLPIGGEAGLEDIAESVESGQTEITSYPIKQRQAIVSLIKSRGGTIYPRKVRDTVNTISAARGVVDTIEELTKQVNTGGARTRLAVGGAAAAGGVLQTRPEVAEYNAARQGFLATLSRATGERGVLTDQDAARARSLLPGIYDSQEVAARKVNQLRTFLANLENRAIQTYTTPKVGGPSVVRNGQPKASVIVIGPKGQRREIDASDLPEAIKRGWKRGR